MLSAPLKPEGRPSPRIRIVEGTIRDFTFVATNMTDDDWREIEAQAPDGVRPLDIALWSLAGAREAWTALADDQPVACFGVSPMTPAGNVLSMWMWGTRRAWRAVPAITRWMEARGAVWKASGATRVEARSIVGHSRAHKWMRGVGALEDPLPCWGKRGEDFILFHWRRDTWPMNASRS